MRKRSKALIITSSILVGIAFTYFGGSVIAYSVIEDKFFNSRGSDESVINEDPYYYLQNTWNDYSDLHSREIIDVNHRNLTLKSYLYRTPNPKGLIISVHGVKTLADSDHAQYQNYFLHKGYDVMSLDLIGCGRSEGNGMVGLEESRFCVSSLLSKIKEIEDIKDLPKSIIGHSWGAYGAVTATYDNDDVSSVIAFGGYDEPANMMVGFARNYAWDGLIVGKPGLDFALNILKGGKVFLNASNVIKTNTHIDYFVIHGKKDNVVSLNNYSIYSNVVNKNYSNVKTRLLESHGHTGLWRTKAANDMLNEYEKRYNELQEEYNYNIPPEIKDSFIEGIDKDKSSELNLELLDEIENYIENSMTK